MPGTNAGPTHAIGAAPTRSSSGQLAARTAPQRIRRSCARVTAT